MKASNDQLIESYQRLKSVWKVAKEFNMCGQSVHERLKKIGVIIPINYWTNEEKEILIDHYRNFTGGKDNFLSGLSSILKRDNTSICAMAKKFGLTNYKRSLSDKIKNDISVRAKKWYSENVHPRGMQGKTHTLENCLKMSQRMKNLPKKIRMQGCLKGMKTKIARYGKTFVCNTPSKVTWKQAWRVIGDRRIYFRSKWESNYGRYLEFLKKNKKIKDWEHEPKTFWFDKIKRGSVTYLPDFKIINIDDSHYWVEVKGWMDSRSKTKIKRFRKYFPNERLIVVGGKEYGILNLQLRSIVPEWES